MKGFVVGYARTTVVGPSSEKTRSAITQTLLVQEMFEFCRRRAGTKLKPKTYPSPCNSLHEYTRD